ncbi:MAG: betB, partial [Bacteroidetes bacterium]|nr:betB [Bacteroidota bacterium]
MREFQLLIDGRFVPSISGRTNTLHNPATGDSIAVVADGSPPDADAAVQAAHRAFALWKRSSSHERVKTLLRISNLIRKNAEELSVLESRNVGKPIRESRDEVQLAADCFQYY